MVESFRNINNDDGVKDKNSFSDTSKGLGLNSSLLIFFLFMLVK